MKKLTIIIILSISMFTFTGCSLINSIIMSDFFKFLDKPKNPARVCSSNGGIPLYKQDHTAYPPSTSYLYVGCEYK